MRPIDLLSSRYYSIKPKGHDGGSSRWRARPVMAAAILLLMSLAVLLPAMVLAQNVNQAPTGLTAVPGDDRGSIQLDWKQSTDANIERYEYQTREVGDTWPANYEFIDRSNCCDDDNDDSATITRSSVGANFDVGTTYEVRIRAVDNSNVGGTDSDMATVTAGPAAVTMLAATAGHQSVTLTWTDDGQDVTHYEYRYKPGTNAWVKGPDRNDSATDDDYTYTVTGLNNDTEYTFQVRAYVLTTDPAIDAPGGAGAEMSATPGTPLALTLGTPVGGYQRIRLDWTDPMDSTITEYQYYALEGGNDNPKWVKAPSADVWKYTTADGESRVFFLVKMTTGTMGADPEVLAGDLAPSTSYSLGLRAVNDNGDGPESEVTESTLGAAADPTTPQGLTATPGPGSGNVTLSWDALTDYAGVAFQYCPTSDSSMQVAACDWKGIDGSNFTTTSHLVTGLD